MKASRRFAEPGDVYVYKLTADNGGAPCVYRGVLSLAICKPKIRRTAQRGDLIVGFGGRALDDRFIYAAYVTDKLERGDYYKERRFHRRPDCIYRDVGGRPLLRSDARYHFRSDELRKDVGRRFENAFVLLSTDFRYLGANGTTRHRDRYPALSNMLDHLFRGHRVHLDPHVRDEVLRLVRGLWKRIPAGQPGRPSDLDTSRRCNTDAGSTRVCP